MPESALTVDDAPVKPQRPGSLLARVRATAAQATVPLHVMLELTDRCNLRCQHCYVCSRPAEGELTLEAWKGILDQTAKAGALFLTLTGGEPLLRRDFFDIAGYARARQFSLVLFTNGTLITPEIADRVKGLCPERVEISILGATAATHDGITAVPGSFEGALRAARLLIERGVQVQLKTSLMRSNIGELEQIQTIAREMGARFRSAFLIIHRRDGDRGPADLRATEEQLRAHVHSLFERVPNGKAPPKTPLLTEEQKKNAAPCGAGTSSGRIDSRGMLYPCAAMNRPLGHLPNESFADLWVNHPDLKRLRAIRLSDLPECSRCELLATCSRCAGAALMETGDMLAAPPQACAITRAFESVFEAKRCDLQ